MGCCKAADVDFKQWMNYFLNHVHEYAFCLLLGTEYFDSNVMVDNEETKNFDKAVKVFFYNINTKTNENDILIARSGATAGKAYIHRELPYTCLYAGYLIRFIVNPKIILPDYLFTYTQLNPY